MKRYIIIFLLLKFCANAQNFNNIPNPSFEVTTGCYPGAGGNFQNIVDWYNPTVGSPDLFALCGDTITLGLTDVVKRHSGYNRVGLFVYDSTHINENVREYVANKLTTNLKAGQQYCFNLYVMPTKNFKYGSDKFGVYFGIGTQFFNNWLIPVVPQLSLPVGVFINDTSTWYNFTNIYTALGGETDIVIGSFTNDSNTNLQIINNYAFASPISYFVIDDISLHEMSINSGDTAVTCPQNMIATIGETNQDTAFKSYWWYDASGALIDSINSQIQVQPVNNTFYIQEKRMCGQSLWDTVYVKIDTVCPPSPPEPPVTEIEFVIPNVFSPNGDGINDVWKVELGGKELQSCIIYNRWGVEQKNIKTQTTNSIKVVTWDGYTTSGIASSDGVYYYLLEVKNAKGEVEKYRGYITLLR